MVKIITDGRTDLKDFFEKSGNFSEVKLTHTPFLVFSEEEDVIRVHIVDSAEKLLKFPDKTPGMGQWQGNFHSDFFQFTVGDYRPYADAKRTQREKSPLTARNVIAEARELEVFFNQHGTPVTVQRE